MVDNVKEWTKQAYNEFGAATKGMYKTSKEKAETLIQILKEQDP